MFSFSFFKQLTIGERLTAGFLITVLITMAVGGLGFFGLFTTVRNADTIANRIKANGQFLVHSVDLARTAQLNFKKQVQEWKDLLLRGGTPADYDKYYQSFEKQEAATQKTLEALKTH